MVRKTRPNTVLQVGQTIRPTQETDAPWTGKFFQSEVLEVSYRHSHSRSPQQQTFRVDPKSNMANQEWFWSHQFEQADGPW